MTKPKTLKEIMTEKEKHHFLCKLQYIAKEKLEQQYLCILGKKVRIYIYIHYLLILLFSGCLCLSPIYENNNLNNTIVNSTTTLLISTSTILTTSTLTTTSTIPTIVNKIVRFVYINQTIDLTKIQEEKLLNLRTKKCFASSCSAGFDECKRSMLDILELKKSVFSERESSHYSIYANPDPEQICIPIHYSVNKTIDILLDSLSWDIYRIDNFTGNYTDTNRTYFNNTLILRRKY